MKYLALIIFISFSSLSFAQDTISVLMIGNSYTYYNNQNSILSDLSASLGNHVTAQRKTNGGYTFALHASDPTTYQDINSNNWDYVILQAQSQEPSFPWGQVNSQTLPYAMDMADSIQSNYPCSQTMFYMTWGRENGDPQWDSINTFNKMNLRLRNAYLRFADSSGGSVSPVGVAWKYVRDNHPNIDLYTNDGSHPSLEGSYLSACTHYASLFQSSPIGASYTAGLDSSIAAILQNAASISVLDSISTWRLKHHDSLAQVSFYDSITTSPETVQFIQNTEYIDSVFWDFGDGNTSNLNNPTHVFNQPGIYTVTLNGYGPCGNNSTQQDIVINSNVGLINTQNNITFKTISEGIYTINISKINIIRLSNTVGQTINSSLSENESGSTKISIHEKGLIFLSFYDQNKVQTIRFWNGQ